MRRLSHRLILIFLAVPMMSSMAFGLDVELATNSLSGAQEHDHEHDHADEGAGLAWLGKLHPLVVHFPIALLLAAGLAELILALGGQKWAWLQGSARFSVLLGGIGALVAAPLGWLAATGAEYGSDLEGTLWWHRVLGTATAASAVALLIASERLARSLQPDPARSFFRALLFATCILIPLTGHLGATLVFGPAFLF